MFIGHFDGAALPLTARKRKCMLGELLKGRGAFIELLFAALILALGVNILSGALVSGLALSFKSQALLAGSLIFLSLLFMARRVKEVGRIRRVFDGFLMYDIKKISLIPIPRYSLSTEVTDYFDSIFAENEAIKRLWKTDPLSSQLSADKKTGKIVKKDVEAGRLVNEAIEYFVLDRLSTHLTDYFNKPPFDRNKLVVLGREDVPSVLFKNRFLDTFSRPMTERPAFIADSTPSAQSDRLEKVVSAYGPNHARYEDFDLVLPQNSIVTRDSSGGIIIETPRMSLSMKQLFSGFMAVTPQGFERFYLRRTDYDNIQTYRVKLVVDVKFKALALFTRAGWDYHMWLDSFLESLSDEFSEKRFLHNISWESAHTIIGLIESARQTEPSVAKRALKRRGVVTISRVETEAGEGED